MCYTKHPLIVSLLFFLCINANSKTISAEVWDSKFGFCYLEFDAYEEGCIKGNCDNGYGIYIYPNGAIYDGEWLNNQRQGKGIMSYEGKAEGDIYDGEWSGNLRHGQGTYSWANGGIYEGDWEADKKDGKGKLYKADGEWYEGEWRTNIKEGKGTYKFNKTDKWAAHTYIGQWKDDKPCCSGVYKYMDGRAFVKDKEVESRGCKLGDCQNGYGEYYYAKDRRYEGEWRNGRFNGEGTFFYETGEKYIGAWFANKREGEGQFYNKEGDLVYDGNWKNDVQSGYGVYHYQNGTRYAGQWKDGEREGKGRFTIPGRGYYEGEFSLDRFNGQGTFHYANQSRYEGGWRDNHKHGNGVEYDTEGGIYRQGIWFSGEFVE